MRNLLLTLGHNSSAILVEDNRIVWGYETERVTGVKSDSRFPSAVMDFAHFTKPDMVYVTHWSPTASLKDLNTKYWNPMYFDSVPIRSLSIDVSHHDTHMHGALCYAGSNFPRTSAYGIVIDGFGTLGEHLSVYELQSGKPKLIKRVYGYDTSLGLFYQYATAFMGMKMHEDEYKLLGYEAHIDPSKAAYIEELAYMYAGHLLDRMTHSKYKNVYDPVYDVNALPKFKDDVFNRLLGVCRILSIDDPSTFEGRVQLAFYVQTVLEHVVLDVVRQTGGTHFVLSGGVFYNVKLNMRILSTIKGKMCVYPLAGDQGNALGLYAHDNPEFVMPADMCWGRRVLTGAGNVPNMACVSTEAEAADVVCSRLDKVGYVNLVRGSMEFGPRALCNTSTLSRPTMKNVQAINAANNRNTVMPMAPVMDMGSYQSMFEYTDRVWRSHAHMITALPYARTPDESWSGVTHKYTYPFEYYTGRPQVVSSDDLLMRGILDANNGILINTSFNFHGKPIALGMNSIVDNHLMQYERDPSTFTVVLRNDE